MHCLLPSVPTCRSLLKRLQCFGLFGCCFVYRVCVETSGFKDGLFSARSRTADVGEKQKHRSRRIRVGADKACDAEDFVTAARALKTSSFPILL